MGSVSKEELGDEDSSRKTRAEHLIDAWVSAELEKRSNPIRRRRARHLTRRRIVSLILVLIAGGVVLQVFSSTFFDPNCGSANTALPSSTLPLRVAVLDGLSSEYPDPSFIANVSASVHEAGYGFDYYPASSMTLSFMVHLPSLGYKIIILRTHGTLNLGEAFTASDSYTQSQWAKDQLLDRLTSIEVNGTRYFGIKPSFITDSVCGQFPRTIVLAMWCNSGRGDSFGQAFLEKGAAAYIGWTNRVTAFHADAVSQWLVKLILEGKTVPWSVQDTMRALGPDPLAGATLSYYPRN